MENPGFNKLKVIAVHAFLRAIAEDRPTLSSFGEALHFEAVSLAIAKSGDSGKRVQLG